MKQLHESLLDNEEDLMNTSDDSTKIYRIKKWLSEHDDYNDWLGINNHKKPIKYEIKNDELYIKCKILELNIDDDIPEYIKIICTDKSAKLQINCDKSLNINGLIGGFNDITIYINNSNGSINFNIPIYTKYLQIAGPINNVNLSKVSAKEIMLDYCHDLNLSKCKFPKGNFKYSLSINVKNKLLKEVYGKYGLNPDNAE